MTVLVWCVGIAIVLAVATLGGLAAFTARTARQVENALPPRGRFIDVDGARLHYIEAGSGPPLVLIHGLAGQHGNFTHSLLDLLQNDHRVIIVDRPGSGYSTRAANAPAGIAAQARTISHFIAALGLRQPLIVGHSLGGAIALSLAVNHPEQVGGLALIAPVTHLPKDVPPIFRGLAIRSPFLRALVARTLAVPVSIRNRHAVLESAFGPQPVPRDYGTKGGGLLNLRPASFINASLDLMAAHDESEDMTARYGHIKVPVGIMYGTADRILDPVTHQAALVEKLPGVDCELIDGGGHMILICSADRCAAFIKRVAQRVPPTGAPQPEKALA
jgi:pimeloyl-ACP methyl ester carboxylesterase